MRSLSGTFSIRKKDEVRDYKYVTVGKTVDAGYYTAVNGKIFFRFDEDYNNPNVNCTILDSKNQSVKIVPQNEKWKEAESNSIDHGYNRFELDLNQYHLASGFYTLQIINQKKEVYKLKFYIE